LYRIVPGAPFSFYCHASGEAIAELRAANTLVGSMRWIDAFL
jgi:hypothetical protein